MPKQDFHAEFDLAKKTLIPAGEIVLSYFNKPLTSRIKDVTSLSSIVTIADEESEAFIRKTLENSFPEHGFIGEETEENNKDVSWIVDPIDGTLAYSRGLEEFGMAIALKKGQEVIFSVMYLPYSHKLYSAYIGKGAFMNDVPIHCSDSATLDQAVISLHKRGFKDEKYAEYTLQMVKAFSTRIHFSAVVESCNLAEGKIDAIVKFRQRIWDLAPEYRLMVESGAEVTDEHGEKIDFTFSKESKQTYLAISKSLSHEEKQRLYLKKS